MTLYQMKLAFILDQLDSIKTYKDSSFAMMREAGTRHHQLFTLQQGDLAWKGVQTMGFAHALELTDKDDDEHRDIVLKPLDGMGGASVFRIHGADHNMNVILETLTHYGTRTIMAQRYIPDIAQGDKRILLIAGKLMPYSLARIPKAGETRANLNAGGTGVAQQLTRRDREIAEALGPVLYDEGLMLVGLDVIGDYLTEINVTSPTCMQEIAGQTGFNSAKMLVDALESRIAERYATAIPPVETELSS